MLPFLGYELEGLCIYIYIYAACIILSKNLYCTYIYIYIEYLGEPHQSPRNTICSVEHSAADSNQAIDASQLTVGQSYRICGWAEISGDMMPSTSHPPKHFRDLFFFLDAICFQFHVTEDSPLKPPSVVNNRI